jgi:hypothetical protein
VKTPVWFVLHDGALYVYTEADSWKVKRVRNNPRVLSRRFQPVVTFPAWPHLYWRGTPHVRPGA